MEGYNWPAGLEFNTGMVVGFKNDQIEKVYAEERACTTSVSFADFRAVCLPGLLTAIVHLQQHVRCKKLSLKKQIVKALPSAHKKIKCSAEHLVLSNINSL